VPLRPRLKTFINPYCKLRLIQNLSKFYLFFGILIVFPLASPFISSVELGALTLDSRRLFIVPLLPFLLSAISSRNFRISRLTLLILLALFYLIVRSLFNGNVYKVEVAQLIFLMIFLISLNNMQFNERDEKLFRWVIYTLAILSFIGSFIQFFINSDFYVYDTIENEMAKVAVKDEFFRNDSFFTALGSEGWYAMGFLSVVILYLNYPKSHILQIVLHILMLFSVAVTFTRSAWIMPFVGYFFYIRRKKARRNILFFVVILSLVILVLSNVTTLLPNVSDVFVHRFSEKSYEGRIVSAQIFASHFFNQKIIFGYGDWSSLYFYQYDRSTVHNALLDWLFRGGVVGLLFFLAIIYELYKIARHSLRVTQNPFLMAIWFMLVLLFVNSSVTGFDYYWYLLIFILIPLYGSGQKFYRVYL